MGSTFFLKTVRRPLKRELGHEKSEDPKKSFHFNLNVSKRVFSSQPPSMIIFYIRHCSLIGYSRASHTFLHAIPFQLSKFFATPLGLLHFSLKSCQNVLLLIQKCRQTTIFTKTNKTSNSMRCMIPHIFAQ